MSEPVADIKIGLRIWKYLGIARELWEQIKAAPEQIAQLDKRVAELEARLKRAPGEACKHCGEWAVRVEKSVPVSGGLGHLGARRHFLKCQKCGFEDQMVVTNSSQSRR